MPVVASAQVEEGFEHLFNGRDLTGWEGDSLLWLVEDGMIVGRSPGIGDNDFLAIEKSCSDFVLRLQVQLVGGAGNSGVQFRSQRVTGSMEMIGSQADIGPTWWGGLYDESCRRRMLVEQDADLINKVVRADGWNDYEIEARGNRIRLKLNGTTTAV
jgi:hypothetical protein